jgi:hypothetical protein
MAVLADADRILAHAELMRRFSADSLPCSIVKADLRAAVNAIDQFLSDNAAAINSAIPQPARGALSTTQKALILMFVIEHRYLSGA